MITQLLHPGEWVMLSCSIFTEKAQVSNVTVLYKALDNLQEWWLSTRQSVWPDEVRGVNSVTQIINYLFGQFGWKEMQGLILKTHMLLTKEIKEGRQQWRAVGASCIDK